MIEEEEKLVASAEFDDENRLVISINDQEVRRTAVKHAGVYKFNFQNEEYHFIYENTENTEKVYFYPLNVYATRILNLQEDDN